MGKSDCILAKVVVFVQIGSIWAIWLYLGNWFYLGKRGSIWAKGGCIWAKVVVFAQIGSILGKLVLILLIGSNWTNVALFGQKVVAFGQSACIWAYLFYLGKLVLLG